MSSDDGLLAHWKFNGDCRDSSGNGNHGTNRGAISRRWAATAVPMARRV